ncbi:MAG TPA: NAD-dependent epimerase/dehydratase family protein, partial [Polyangiaceae bacterium]|nr:NAD-dependent epimerase/dehydratase family protein [Polyangiaceae bacterium]
SALIVGITGGIGRETARALLAAGWRVRALHRAPEKVAPGLDDLGPIEWVKGDAMNAADVVAAAGGVGLVLHAANPAGYKNWQGLQLPMLESSIAAAKAASARLVFPGTVYNFGPDAFPLVDEASPQRPETRKGRIRVQMEERLKAAADSGVPVLVVRAGDFFGPRSTGNSWFSAALVKPGRRVRSVMYPGARDVGHAWAYLPDLAQTIVQLVERSSELRPFDVFHFGGHWFERGVEMAEATCLAAGVPVSKIRSFPWFAIYLLAPFAETFREMLEMRYLWKVPVRLDNRKLVAFLGREPHTPIDVALRRTLQGLNCVNEDGLTSQLSSAI